MDQLTSDLLTSDLICGGQGLVVAMVRLMWNGGTRHRRATAEVTFIEAFLVAFDEVHLLVMVRMIGEVTFDDLIIFLIVHLRLLVLHWTTDETRGLLSNLVKGLFKG